jgi:exonuclease III
MLSDDELWARIGVLLVRIDVGVGVLDVYLTHLYFGTGLGLDSIPMVGPLLHAPNNTERADIRSAQLKELSNFIETTHHAGNVAMVCGDFNIDANEHDPEYSGSQALQQFTSRHDLQDMWLSPHGELPGCTGGDFGKICIPVQPPNDSPFCNETTDSESSNGYRIDFLLVERPQPGHSFMLDVTRVRRRSFPRPQVTEDQTHMSDHLGLDCTLLASRK